MSADRIPAKGEPRSCPTCHAKRDLYVLPRRGRQDEMIYRGHCTVCANYVGDVPPSKIEDADKLRLELLLEELSPPTRGLFDAFEATAPTDMRKQENG